LTACLRGKASLIHSVYDQLVPITPSRRYAHELDLPMYEVECGHSLPAEVPKQSQSLP
jgi:hypothetical protein